MDFPPIVLEQWEKDELISQVVKIATKAMFNNHFYKFGGKMFKQREGGPIGLRGTCAVARLVLQMFDLKWESRLMDMRIKVWLITRYMDDARIFLPPIKPGWRISDGKLLFCQKWEEEDKNLSPTEVTRRVVLDSLKDVVKYLRFTTETCEDYESGWLPTLDTSLQVDLNNHIKFKFFEKPVGPGRMIQKKTAMPENSKVQIISNEMIRRLLNSGEDLQEEEYIEIVDSYAQKLVNSGYGINQVRRMLISGIRGYGGKVNRCKELGIDLRRTANKSQGTRNIKKLTGRTTWFKKRKEKIDWYGMSQGAHGNGRGGPLEDQGAQPKQSNRQGGAEESSPASTVLFVEQTHGGALASKMRELVARLENVVGFKVKVVERCGSTLGSRFSQNSLWQGNKCGRSDCITCEQGAEVIPDCTVPSIIYENFSAKCNPGAGAKNDIKEASREPPSVYVGETSRSIKERSKEHWSGYVKEDKDNHMFKHFKLHHEGDLLPPKFIMRVVTNPRTALQRQVGEAVRIRRRGERGLYSKQQIRIQQILHPPPPIGG